MKIQQPTKKIVVNIPTPAGYLVGKFSYFYTPNSSPFSVILLAKSSSHGVLLWKILTPFGNGGAKLLKKQG